MHCFCVPFFGVRSRRSQSSREFSCVHVLLCCAKLLCSRQLGVLPKARKKSSLVRGGERVQGAEEVHDDGDALGGVEGEVLRPTRAVWWPSWWR